MHLVILTVGFNPIPCLASAFRLCKALRRGEDASVEYPRFLVLGSSAKQADAIRSTLVDRLKKDSGGTAPFLDWRYVDLDDRRHEPFDPAAIYNKTLSVLQTLKGVSEVHCAYTGGTSAMAVHSIEAARDHFHSSDVLQRFCYLSSRTHHMQTRGFDYYPEGLVDERMVWDVSIPDLALLHGLKFRSAQPAPDLPGKAVEQHDSGKALESYAWHMLSGVLDGATRVLFNVRCEEIHSHVKDFELDVAAVLGYQLIAISCTNAKTQNICKDKAFEVLHRAQQLGGELARSVLLCRLPTPGVRELTSDLEHNVGRVAEDRKLLILGEEFLKDFDGERRLLESALTNWLTTNLKWRV